MPLTATLFVLLSFFAVVAVIPAACRAAVRFRFVDRPGGRKSHKGAVPPVGGLVILPVFLIFSYFAVPPVPGFGSFVAALVLTVSMGAVDDYRGLPARVKFIGQFAAATLMVVGGHANIANLGNLLGFGDIWLGWASAPFSIVATVLLMNAINLMDGLDGLAGGKGFIALAWLFVAAFFAGAQEYFMPLGFLMASLAGFLVYNMRHPFREKASVFLGDSGSLGLGLCLAWFALKLADGGVNADAVAPAAVAWVLALPIMDTCGQFARRVREGRHPFDADQHHFHHHFVAVGMDVRRATVLILALSALTGFAGVCGIAAGIPAWVLGYLWIVLLLTHIYLSMKPERMKTIVARFHRDGGK